MGWALVIDEQRRLALWLGDGAGHLVQTAAPEPLKAGLWYSAGASYDGASRARDRASGTGSQRRQFAGRAGRDASAGVHARGDRRAGQLPLAIGGCDRRMGGRHGCFRSHHRGRPLQRQNRSPARLRACARRSATRRTGRGTRTGQPRADRAMGLRRRDRPRWYPDRPRHRRFGQRPARTMRQRAARAR